MAKVSKAEASAIQSTAERSAVQLDDIRENIGKMITRCPICADIPVPDVVAIKGT